MTLSTSKLSRIPGVQAIFLFGSQVTGEAGPLSDVDICVIAPGVSEYYKSEILGSANENTDIVLFEDLPLPIKARIFREGRLLFCRNKEWVADLSWRTTKEYFDFKPILKEFIEMYLPGVEYV